MFNGTRRHDNTHRVKVEVSQLRVYAEYIIFFAVFRGVSAQNSHGRSRKDFRKERSSFRMHVRKGQGEDERTGDTIYFVYVPFAWFIARDGARGLRYNSNQWAGGRPLVIVTS